MISFIQSHLVFISVVLIASVGCDSKDAPTAPQTSQTTPSPHAPPSGSSASFVPTDPELIADNNRGVGLMGMFQYEDARKVFADLAAKHPDWLEVQVNLAIAILNRQQEADEEVALRILESVLKADPGHLRAHFCSGILLDFLGEPEKALEHFKFVAQADPKDAYACYYMGKSEAAADRLEEAVQWHRRAIENDPYLRSPYNACSLLLRRLNRPEEADQMLAEFKRLETNPRSTIVKTVYTRMGPKAEAIAVDLPAERRQIAKPPEGPLFLDPVPLLENGDQFKWMVRNPDRPVSITACDVNGDELIDVFIANVLDEDDGVRNAVCINQGDAKFKLDLEHALASVPDVNAAVWGDYDNDGLTDVYLCRRGPNMLWRQTEKEKWQDVTAATGTANGELDTVDGALVDFDHDGDLDVFCVNADGPNELLNNNMDGTFRGIAQERGIAGNGKGSRQVLPVDLDSDRDLDIIVINREPPHDVWMNDRLWQYRESSELERLQGQRVQAIAASDSNADGAIEFFAAHASGATQHWMAEPGGWVGRELPNAREALGPSCIQIASIGVDGDASPEIMVSHSRGPVMYRRSAEPDTEGWEETIEPRMSDSYGWAMISAMVQKGPALVIATGNGPLIWRPGLGRLPYTSLALKGSEVTKDNQPVRSNASGIGTHFAARIDSTWVMGSTLRNYSGPGQSLQPIAIGLGGHKQIDYLSIDWSDGVFQTEMNLEAGKLHKIVETQRQLSSCPVLFAWNGKKYEFITDLLGVGGIGYMVAPGTYAPSRPWESLLLPTHALQSKDGTFVLKLSEPMEEACYLDAARLVCYDLPSGYEMTIDERMSIMGPEPTGAARFYASEVSPTRAVNDRGEDVTSAIVTADLAAAPVGELDSRFIGRLKRHHALTLTFDRAMNDSIRMAPSDGRSHGERADPILIIDGWIEYPYSQTMFAASQANAEYRAPTIEALGADGQWHIALEQFGYPAGMPRQMSVPLANLPDGTTELRITTNQEIYWDRIAVAYADAPPPEGLRRTELPLVQATLAQTGFPKRTTGPQRQPHYDYDRRAPFWDTRYQAGFYTQLGCVDELIGQTDDALAIFGPGEEVHLEFDAAALPELPAGFTRHFVLEVNGWCKDMDLFTQDGETIEPLPWRSGGDTGDSARRAELHRRFNTRYEAGR